MGRLPRSASRLILATVLLAGCATTPASPPQHALPSTLPLAAWSVNPCFVADTTARTGDTLYVVGASQRDGDTSAVSTDCRDSRIRRPVASPVVVSVDAPPGVDLRELLDAAPATGANGHRADVVVTRDPDVIAYAATRAGFLVATLPWSGTYLLVPARAGSESGVPASAERDALARDAVTADARGAAEPFAWLTDSACAAPVGTPPAGPRPVIAYTTGDETARQLAERIVSLAGAGGRPPWLATIFGAATPTATARIAALPADSIPDALATGRATAAVLPIGRDPRTACAAAGNARVPRGAVPLVDARAHVIVRRGSGAAFLIAPDGSLHFIRWSTP